MRNFVRVKMDVFKIDGRESAAGRHPVHHHHHQQTEVSFDTTSDFNLSFFDASSTPPDAGPQQPVVLKEELVDGPEPASSPPLNDPAGQHIFSPPPVTPPSPVDGDVVKIKNEFGRPSAFLSPSPTKSSSTPPSTPSISTLKNGKLTQYP